MNQATIEILKLLVMLAAAVIALVVRRDIIPYIRSKTTAEQFRTAQEMAEMFVYMAGQMFKDKTGEQRKEIVRNALRNALNEAGIQITDQFMDDMIEAAYKGMKIAERRSAQEGGV